MKRKHFATLTFFCSNMYKMTNGDYPHVLTMQKKNPCEMSCTIYRSWSFWTLQCVSSVCVCVCAPKADQLLSDNIKIEHQRHRYSACAHSRMFVLCVCVFPAVCRLLLCLAVIIFCFLHPLLSSRTDVYSTYIFIYSDIFHLTQCKFMQYSLSRFRESQQGNQNRSVYILIP